MKLRRFFTVDWVRNYFANPRVSKIVIVLATLLAVSTNRMVLATKFLDGLSPERSLELSPKLRQTVKTQFSLNGDLSHGIVSTNVHERV